MTTLSSMEMDIIRSISLCGEHWKQAKGFSSNYYVSNMGRILSTKYRNAKRVEVMRPALDQNGYYRTVMDGKTVKVHRIVAENWLENPNRLPFVNHINCITTDNQVENLEFCTPKYNAWWSTKKGRIRQPLRPANTRHTNQEREWVRTQYLLIAKKLGHSLEDNLARARFYDDMCKKFPDMARASIKDWANGRWKSYHQDLTTQSVCNEHHIHIVSEENIII